MKSDDGKANGNSNFTNGNGKSIPKNKEVDSDLGDKLKSARALTRLTQQDVADALGTQKQNIYYLENGSKSLMAQYLKLLRGKGIDINSLFD